MTRIHIGRKQMLFNSRKEAMGFVYDNSRITNVVATNPYTMVIIQCTINGQILESVGFSKCRPGDVYDKERGIAIAHGRAVAAVAKRLYGKILIPHVTLDMLDMAEQFQTGQA